MLGDADAERHLARRDVAGARLDDLAEDHVLDLLGCDARALERSARGSLAERDGRHGREAAADLRERRARGAEDHRGHARSVSAPGVRCPGVQSAEAPETDATDWSSLRYAPKERRAPGGARYAPWLQRASAFLIDVSAVLTRLMATPSQRW